MKNSAHVGIVMLGGDFQALGAVRSLAVKGVPVYLVDYELGICRYSRFVKKRVLINGLLNPDLFADKLIDLARRENVKGWVLMPNNDELIKLLSINMEKLDKWYKIPVPNWEVVKLFYFKNNAYRLAEQISIPVPTIYRGQNLEEFLSQNLSYPIVLKPAYKEKYYPITKKKAIRVNDENQFVQEYNAMSSIIDPSEIVVQEFLDGGPKNLYSYVGFFSGDRFDVGMAARRLRQHPMDFGHATTYAVSVDIPTLRDMAERLLCEMGFFGIAEVEFMYDEKVDQFKFIEINGRIWGWHTLAKAAGVNVPYAAWQYMIGAEIDSTEPKIDVKWIRLLTDIPTVVKEICGGRMRVKDYFRSIKGKKEFAVFSIKDPLPFFMEIFHVPYLWWKRGF